MAQTLRRAIPATSLVAAVAGRSVICACGKPNRKPSRGKDNSPGQAKRRSVTGGSICPQNTQKDADFLLCVLRDLRAEFRSRKAGENVASDRFEATPWFEARRKRCQKVSRIRVRDDYWCVAIFYRLDFTYI